MVGETFGHLRDNCTNLAVSASFRVSFFLPGYVDVGIKLQADALGRTNRHTTIKMSLVVLLEFNTLFLKIDINHIDALPQS